MRVEEESCLALAVGGETLHLLVGAPHGDGTVTCHLLDEHVSAAAYVVILDLTGQLRHAQAVVLQPEQAPHVLAGLHMVDPATWRQGLATGLRRRLALLEQLRDEATDTATGNAERVARARAEIATVECEDPTLRAALATLAPTWTGTVQDLHAAAVRVLNT